MQVWHKAHALVLAVYRVSADFPLDERFGQTSQVRRACVSIPANIAQGCGRRTDDDFARFLDDAMGSAGEVEYHLLLARDLGLLGADGHERVHEQTTEVKRMLASFLGKLRAERLYVQGRRTGRLRGCRSDEAVITGGVHKHVERWSPQRPVLRPWLWLCGMDFPRTLEAVSLSVRAGSAPALPSTLKSIWCPRARIRKRSIDVGAGSGAPCP